MDAVIGWQDVAARIAAAIVAGLVVGWNREERSEAAGLRTTVLVCLAACLAMVLANLLLMVAGKPSNGFSQMDVLRLPLGILTGIGFIGAGAIIKRGDVVTGVTTAATIWLMTVVGICIGAGQLVLGGVAALLAVLLLWALRWADARLKRTFRASLTVSAERERFPEQELRRAIEETGHRIVLWSVAYENGATRYQTRIELEWRGHERDRGQEPTFVRSMALNPAVLTAEWIPAQIGH